MTLVVAVARPPRYTDAGTGRLVLRDPATRDRATRAYGNGYGLKVGDPVPAYRFAAGDDLIPAVEGADDTGPLVTTLAVVAASFAASVGAAVLLARARRRTP